MKPPGATETPSDGASVLCRVTLVPLVGPLHLTYPAWNTVNVLEALQRAEPTAIATTALHPGQLDEPSWQDTPELALPHTVMPWAVSCAIPVAAIGVSSPDPAAAQDFARYAHGYMEVRRAWQEAERLEAPLRELLAKPLTLDRIIAEALPLVAAPQRVREEAFGDGPATDWLRHRAAEMADRLAAMAGEMNGTLAVLVPLDHLPMIRESLGGRLDIGFVAAAPPSEASRRRSLLDYAMRVEVANPEEVIRSLREIDGAEARYHEANLLLAHGHLAEALELLERASREDFSHPYFLPGYLLARLGQMYDLAGRRDAAVRAYRGVRALSYAPPEAMTAAARGIEHPFAMEDASE